MSSETRKIIEHVFFFAILIVSAYLLWKLFAPFAGALALAAIIVTISFPMHKKIIKFVPKNNKSVAAFISLFVVLIIIILPLTILASLISKEALSIYASLNTSDHSSLVYSITQIQGLIQSVVPGFYFDLSAIFKQAAVFVSDSLFTILAGTVSTVFLFFIALIGTYFFFKDGKFFTTYLIKLSPLDDADDEKILRRLAVAVRSVALGTVAVAMLQGILTSVGLAIFQFERYILLGLIAAIGALVPGIGTAIVFVPSVLFLIYKGQLLSALLLGIWGAVIVGLIDNIIGPKIMSRHNKMHPFLILISVLGGLLYFGPIGFILGPVILSLFLVLLELYDSHIKNEL